MKMGDLSPELAEESKQLVQQQMNLHMNGQDHHQIRLQTPSPATVQGHHQYQVQTPGQGHSLQNNGSPAISPANHLSPNHLFSPQGQFPLAVSPVNVHTSSPSCSATPPITIKTDLDAQDTMTSCA